MNDSKVEMGEKMPYELTWYMPNKVLLLTLSGNYMLEDAKEVNQLIVDELNQSKTPLFILIDVMQMNRPYHFSDIRAVQTFMNHRQLKHIYVVTSNRLMKLAMIVIFNLGRAYLHMCDDIDKATFLLERDIATFR